MEIGVAMDVADGGVADDGVCSCAKCCLSTLAEESRARGIKSVEAERLTGGPHAPPILQAMISSICANAGPRGGGEMSLGEAEAGPCSCTGYWSSEITDASRSTETREETETLIEGPLSPCMSSGGDT